MKCTNCGTDLVGKPKFCIACGEKVNHNLAEVKEQPEVKTQTKKKANKEKDPSKNKVGTILKWGIALIALVGIAFFTYSKMETENAYKQAIEAGTDSLLIEDYEQAAAHFQTALDNKANDEVATNLLTQSKLYSESLALFEAEDYPNALEKAKEVAEYELSSGASQSLTKKANELVNEIESLETNLAEFKSAYDEANRLYKNGNTEEALDSLETVLKEPSINNAYYTSTKEEIESLITRINTSVKEKEEAARIKEEEERVAADRRKKEQASEKSVNSSLSDYKAIEIEYARIIEMIGYPQSSTVYISKQSAGSPVAAGYEETVKFPTDVTFISGEVSADGMIAYSSHGDGHITIYPMPSHWHQDDQSDEGYQEYAQSIIDNTSKVYVDPGNDQDIIYKLENTTFVY